MTVLIGHLGLTCMYLCFCFIIIGRRHFFRLVICVVAHLDNMNQVFGLACCGHDSKSAYYYRYINSFLYVSKCIFTLANKRFCYYNFLPTSTKVQAIDSCWNRKVDSLGLSSTWLSSNFLDKLNSQMMMMIIISLVVVMIVIVTMVCSMLRMVWEMTMITECCRGRLSHARQLLKQFLWVDFTVVRSSWVFLSIVTTAPEWVWFMSRAITFRYLK